MYTARKFNRKSYEYNNDYAKSKFIKYIEKRGHTVLSSKENYEHDVVTIKDGKKYYFELQMQNTIDFTSKDDYCFDTVRFFGRKKRLHHIHEYSYIMICRSTNYAVVANSSEIFKEENREEICYTGGLRPGYDEVYSLPKHKCKFFYIG